MTEPKPELHPPKRQHSVAYELSAIWEFAKRDWSRTKRDLAELREEIHELREKQKHAHEPHLATPGGLKDYKPTRGKPPEERHGWRVHDPHHGAVRGHRETGR